MWFPKTCKKERLRNIGKKKIYYILNVINRFFMDIEKVFGVEVIKHFLKQQHKSGKMGGQVVQCASRYVKYQ